MGVIISFLEPFIFVDVGGTEQQPLRQVTNFLGDWNDGDFLEADGNNGQFK